MHLQGLSHYLQGCLQFSLSHYLQGCLGFLNHQQYHIQLDVESLSTGIKGDSNLPCSKFLLTFSPRLFEVKKVEILHTWKIQVYNMGVSKNNGTPKPSILIGFSIINHPFGDPLFLETSTCRWICPKKRRVTMMHRMCPFLPFPKRFR